MGSGRALPQNQRLPHEHRGRIAEVVSVLMLFVLFICVFVIYCIFLARRELGDFPKYSRKVYVLFGAVWSVCGAILLETMFSSQVPGRWTCNTDSIDPNRATLLLDASISCGKWHDSSRLAPHGRACHILKPEEITFDAETSFSIVSEWSLVCSASSAIDFINVAYFVGYLIGSGLFGWCCDRFGRKWSYQSATLLTVAAVLAHTASTSVTQYLVSRGLVGVGVAGLILASYLIATEYVGTAWQALCGTIFSCFFSLGMVAMSPVSGLFPTWRLLSCVCAFPLLLLMFLSRDIPESPRWLACNGRQQEAVDVMKLITDKSSGNSADIEKHFTTPKLLGWNPRPTSPGGTVEKPVSALDLFTSPLFRRAMLATAVVWCVSSFDYYGISLSSAALPGSMAVNSALSALIEIPAYIFVARNLGANSRKRLLQWTLTITTVSTAIATLFQGV